MKCTSRDNARPFLARANLAHLDLAHPNGARAPAHATSMPAQHDCGSLFHIEAAQSFAIARSLVAWLWTTEPRSCLVDVFEWGIWPSCENLSLFYAWRRSLDATATLDDATAHEFLQFEMDQMVSLVQMSVAFGWGITAISGDATAIFTLDHDGRLTAFADAPERAARLASAIAPA